MGHITKSNAILICLAFFGVHGVVSQLAYLSAGMGDPAESPRQASPPGLAKPWGTCNPIPHVQVGNAPLGANVKSERNFGQLFRQVHLPCKDQTAGVKKFNIFTEKNPKTVFKHKIFFYLSLKATHGHFCLSAFFFPRRYLHLHLFTAWLYLHSQEYSIRNTKYREKKFLKKLVPDFRKIITQGNDKSLQCWAYRCSFDTKSSSRVELH